MKRVLISTLILLFSGTAAVMAEDQIITVKKGETLTKIAKKYLNDPKRWREFLKYNNIANPNLIYPGRKLKLPDFLAKAALAKIVFKTGPVSYKVSKSLSWKNAKINQGLYYRDSIKTGNRGRAKLKIGKNTRVTVKPKTFLVINKNVEKAAQGNSLLLKSGGLHAFVRKTNPRTNFSVRTPASVAGVRGTDFITEVDEKGNSKLACYSGEVAVGAQNKTVYVKEGQATYVEKGKAPQEPFALLPAPTPR